LTLFDDRQKNFAINFRAKIYEWCETSLLICRQFGNVDNVGVDEETDKVLPFVDTRKIKNFDDVIGDAWARYKHGSLKLSNLETNPITSSSL